MASSSIHSFWIIFVLPFSALAQNNGIVPVGTRLTADGTSKPWLSQSGDFAFGFKQTQDKELFLLSIWYDKIPDKTIVWFPNSIDPVRRGSTLELNVLAGLVLRDPQGEPIWNSEGIADEVHQGVMNDTGNFILKRTDFQWIWETFAHAADTILPLQELVYQSVLISRKSETNFSRGRFNLRFLDNGNLVLTTRSLPTNSENDAEYYNSQLSNTSSDGSASGVRVIFEKGGSIYIRRRNNQTKVLAPPAPPSASENYFRATLNFDGVFTQYYHPRHFTGNSSWIPNMNLPNNICTSITVEKGSVACGYNSVCRIDDNERPVCECPEGYELLDSNDKYGECKPRFALSCDGIEQGSGEDLYDFYQVPDTDWPLNDYQMLTNFTEEKCRQSCMQDCKCAVAIFRSNTCWKKQLPLSNGRRDVSVKAKALLKYNKQTPGLPKDNEQTPGLPKDKGKNKALMLAIGISSAGIVTIISLLILFCKFKKPSSRFILLLSKRIGNDGQNLDALIKQFGILAPKRYTYSEIKKITNSLKNKLGSGGYGDVYKGILFDGFPVAVKIMNASKGDGEDFVNEVASISRTSHVNIVTLLGFCLERQKRALIYEFVPNGSLEKFIYSKSMQKANCHLGWEKLYQISLGVARGLEYLHRGCSTRILHFDIKPHNILLDEDFVPKISDFGLSKQCTRKESIISMLETRGTIGYIAPEVISRHFGGVSHKSDVYSYGMMVLEMVGGRKNISVEASHTSEIYFPHWVYHHLVVEEDLELQGVESQEANEIARKMIIVGLWCIQTDPLRRPSMAKVIEMLEGSLQALEIPPKPFFGSIESSTEDYSTTIELS